MFNIILGILVGFCLPGQATVNGKLKASLNSQYRASQISALITFFLLLIALVLTGEGLYIPLGTMAQNEPWWMWTGGIMGALVIIGSIMVFIKLGAVQSAILPMAGQIVMGILIDAFGLFGSARRALSLTRGAGALMVMAGVIIITLARFSNSRTESRKNLLPMQLLGILIGMCNASQMAVNVYLRSAAGSALKATLVNNVVCNIAIAIVAFLMLFLGKDHPQKLKSKGPWWMWLGGFLGMGTVVGNIVIASRVGTGYGVVLTLIGTTLGGVLIDHFGLFEAQQKKITPKKVLGIVLMLAGSIIFRVIG